MTAPAVIEPGLCQCGCGAKTRIAPKDDSRYGQRRGEPRRYIAGHNGRLSQRGSRRIPDDAPPCDGQFAGTCSSCGAKVHRAKTRRCRQGHPAVAARGACATCYCRARRTGTVIDLPRRNFTRDELLEEWEALRGEVSFRQFHQRVGVSHRTWERAYLRARQDGDPRAVKTAAALRSAG